MSSVDAQRWRATLARGENGDAQTAVIPAEAGIHYDALEAVISDLEGALKELQPPAEEAA